MKLVPESKHAARLWSVRLAVISAGLAAAEASLPLWEEPLPAGIFATLASVVGIASAVARVIKQSLPHE